MEEQLLVSVEKIMINEKNAIQEGGAAASG